MRSGVSFGKCREIFARNSRAGDEESPSEEEAGTQSETSSSSLGSSLHAAPVPRKAGGSRFCRGSDCAHDPGIPYRITTERREIRPETFMAHAPRHRLGADRGRQHRLSIRKITSCRPPVYRPRNTNARKTRTPANRMPQKLRVSGRVAPHLPEEWRPVS